MLACSLKQAEGQIVGLLGLIRALILIKSMGHVLFDKRFNEDSFPHLPTVVAYEKRLYPKNDQRPLPKKFHVMPCKFCSRRVDIFHHYKSASIDVS